MTDAPADSRRWLVVAALLVGTFLSSLDVTLVSTAMPRIAADLHGLDRYAWVFSGYLLASTVMVPIYGKLADLIGRRRTFFLGMSLFLVGSALCGAAGSMEVLVAARVVQGLGGASIYTLTMIIFGDLFDVAERARAQGLLGVVWAVSSLFGPAAGGAFVSFWSWRWAFLINLPIGFAALLLFAIAFRERVERTRPPVDAVGAVLLAAGLAALLGGFGRPPVDLRLIAVAAVLLAALVAVERRAVEPVVPPGLFRDPVFAISCAANCLSGLIVFAYVAYLPLFLQGVRGLSPLIAGLLVAPDTITWTLGSFAAGRWILAAGYRPVIRGGFALVAVAALATRAAAAIAHPWLALAVYLGSLLLLGAGLGLTTSTLLIVVQQRVDWGRRGAATGTLLLTRLVGATLGTAALGTLLLALLAPRLAAIAGAPAPEALVDSSRWAAIPPSVLAPSRAALAGSLTAVAWVVVAAAVLALAVASRFPDVRAAEPADKQAVEPAATSGS